MIELSDTAYLWIKALHIISVIAWMAGLLYLPRLFVYHVDAEPGSELSETLKIMERRLLKLIMNPAMLASLFFGILLLLGLGGAAWNAAWIRRGQDHPAAEILSYRQRGPDGADGRDRHLCRRAAVLTAGPGFMPGNLHLTGHGCLFNAL